MDLQTEQPLTTGKSHGNHSRPHYWWVLWVIAGWGLNIALSLAWYLFDCDDECNYRNR